MAKTGEKYEGFTNYETWLVALWVDNDEGLYNEKQERVQSVTKDCDESGLAEARTKLATELKDWITELTPDLGATLWSDLLTAAIGEVDWLDLVQHWIPDERLSSATSYPNRCQESVCTRAACVEIRGRAWCKQHAIEVIESLPDEPQSGTTRPR